MRIFVKGKLIVVETNLAWAVPYWAERQRLNPEAKITWQIAEELK
jgi:hypothetical protein